MPVNKTGKSRRRRYVLVTFATLIYLVISFKFEYLMDATKQMWQPMLQLTTASGLSVLPKNSFLHQECYEYLDFNTVRFNCSSDASMYKMYSRELILQCASKIWNITRDRNNVDPWQENLNQLPQTIHGAEAAFKRPAVHLVFLGDSHIRYVFKALIARIADPRSYYKMGNDNWKSLDVLKRFNEHFIATTDVVHLDIPLKITFIWEPFFEHFPTLLKKWLAGEGNPPTYLILNSAMHFMMKSKPLFLAKGLEEASEKYSQHLKFIAPLVAELANTTSVIFKLQDYILGEPQSPARTRPNINLYNQIALNILSERQIAVWNSTIPLSNLYNEECKTSNRNTPDWYWKCNDKMHIGYVTVDEYVNMLLNELCYPVM